jgi:hypothetical protein
MLHLCLLSPQRPEAFLFWIFVPYRRSSHPFVPVLRRAGKHNKLKVNLYIFLDKYYLVTRNNGTRRKENKWKEVWVSRQTRHTNVLNYFIMEAEASSVVTGRGLKRQYNLMTVLVKQITRWLFPDKNIILLCKVSLCFGDRNPRNIYAVHVILFWNLSACSLVEKCQRFRQAYYLYIQGKRRFLRLEVSILTD